MDVEGSRDRSTTVAFGDDPRFVEYCAARGEVHKGLSAAPGASERYMAAIGPYISLLDEHAPADSLVRRHLMRALYYNSGLPLGSILAGFRATKAEHEFIVANPPIRDETVDVVAELRAMPYGAYLKTPHWRTVRAEALKRAEDRCQVCATTDRLQVHHRDYTRRGAERPADVVVLCDRCHKMYHDNQHAA